MTPAQEAEKKEQLKYHEDRRREEGRAQAFKESSFMRAPQVKRFLEDPRTPASCLLILCLDEWGTNFLQWEPDTFLIQAQQSWGAQLPTANRDKIWALVTHLTTNLFYVNLQAFVNICNALNGHGASFEQFEPAEVDELAWGIVEAQLVDPPQKGGVFCPDIKAYLGARLKYEGFQRVPKPLKGLVRLPDRQEETNQVLGGDAIDFKAYWDMQSQRVDAVEAYVRDRLQVLFSTLGALPLVHADQKSLSALLSRAQGALAISPPATALDEAAAGSWLTR